MIPVGFLSDIMFSLPSLNLILGDSLDRLLGMDRLLAAVCIYEVLALARYVESLLVTCGIAKLTVCILSNDLSVFGIVFNLANDLLHYSVLLSVNLLFYAVGHYIPYGRENQELFFIISEKQFCVQEGRIVIQ